MSKNDKTPNGFSINKGTDLSGVPFSGIFGTDTVTPVGRIAFVDLVTPKGQRPKYGLALLVSKTDEKAKPELKALQEKCKLMAIDFWGDKAGDMLKKAKRPFLGNGDEPSSTGKIYEGYAGNWVINARNKNSSDHAQGFKVLGNMLPDQFQSGMLCRLVVAPYLNADGYSYTLRAIKLVNDDGVRFGGAPDPTGLLDNLDDAVSAVNSNIGSVDLAGLI